MQHPAQALKQQPAEHELLDQGCGCLLLHGVTLPLPVHLSSYLFVGFASHLHDLAQVISPLLHAVCLADLHLGRGPNIQHAFVAAITLLKLLLLCC